MVAIIGRFHCLTRICRQATCARLRLLPDDLGGLQSALGLDDLGHAQDAPSRRDHFNLFDRENFGVVFDTFHDRRHFDNIAKASTKAFESRQIEGRFETEFQGGDQLNFRFSRNSEVVDSSFNVAGGLTVPPGSYQFDDFEVRYQMGPQRRFAGSLGFLYGGLYGGTRTQYQLGQGRIEVNSHLSIEPQIRIDRIDAAFGKVTTQMVSGRVNWTISPRMLVSALTRYHSTNNQPATNSRFAGSFGLAAICSWSTATDGTPCRPCASPP